MANRTLLVLLSVLLAAGCFYTHEAESSETRSWPAGGLTAINVDTEGGSVTVTAWSDTTISARIIRFCRGTDSADAARHLADMTTFDSVSSGALNLRAEMPQVSTRNYSVSYELSAPARTDLRLQTTGGAISLNNTDGNAMLVTTGGAITASPHAGTIAASTTGGAIAVDLARFDTTDTAALHTTGGAVTLSLPADASFHFDATTSGSNVDVSDFNPTYTVNQSTHKVGTVGTGRAGVTISTTGGSVRIKKR